MQLAALDWLAIVAYFAANRAIGLYYRRRATGSTEDYFVSGRNVSWWLAGTSMVATTFAADTPLAVTGLVASFGIAGNWLWWSMLMSGMLTVFFYARLWRRSGVLTDLEFYELRYSGNAASAVRGDGVDELRALAVARIGISAEFDRRATVFTERQRAFAERALSEVGGNPAGVVLDSDLGDADMQRIAGILAAGPRSDHGHMGFL